MNEFDDEQLAARAREVGAMLRLRPGNLDREAGWLMKELADRPAAPVITDADRRLIARAREMPPDVTMDTLRRLTGYDAGASDELVKSAAIGRAAVLLAELADRLERHRAADVIVLAWCKRCEHGTASVPCPRDAEHLACSRCGRCPRCDGDLPAEEE